MSFGERVKQRRKELKLTQRELAGLVGISRSAVNSWEMGDHIPGGDPAMRLPGALSCSWEWLTSGKGSPIVQDEKTKESPVGEERSPVPLIEKNRIQDFLAGDMIATANAGEKSSLIRDSMDAGARTFAYTETSDGMSPRIEPGDTVYIDPDATEMTPGREIYLVKTDGGYMLGSAKETPRGVMLYFDNPAPGWEPIPVKQSDCCGKLVAFVPSWL